MRIRGCVKEKHGKVGRLEMDWLAPFFLGVHVSSGWPHHERFSPLSSIYIFILYFQPIQYLFQWWEMRTFSNFQKRKSLETSGNSQASENFWKFMEICENFHPRFPQISITFRRFFKKILKFTENFWKMVKWVKMFC